MNIGQLSCEQIKNAATKSLNAWKAKFDAGEIPFNINNQFDLQRHDSAIECLDKGITLGSIKESYKGVELSSMSSHDWFNALSDFDAPEISRGWVD